MTLVDSERNLTVTGTDSIVFSSLRIFSFTFEY